MNKRKKIIIAALSVIVFLSICTLSAILYINSGYRTIEGSFGYKITVNTRKYEFQSTNGSLDIFQIIDMSKAENDCYIYVGTYDPKQNLQETLDAVNEAEGTNLTLMTITVGSGDYPASFVSYIAENGGYAHMYYVDYMGHNYVISTLTDKKHEAEIEKMLASFTIM